MIDGPDSGAGEAPTATLISVVMFLVAPPVGPILFYGGVIWLLVAGHWGWAIALFLVGSLITFIVTGINDRRRSMQGMELNSHEPPFRSPSSLAATLPTPKFTTPVGLGPVRYPGSTYADARAQMEIELDMCRNNIKPYANHPAALALLQRIDQYSNALSRPDYFAYPLNQTLAVGQAIIGDQQRLLTKLTSR